MNHVDEEDDGRVVPVQGTEAQRAHFESLGVVLEGELTTTSDGKRVFKNANEIVSGGKWLGTVADTSTRILLNTSQALGCWPGDMCKQADNGKIYRCISNRGALDADWFDISPGEANTASNVGSGNGIFASKVGVDLRFKTLVAGAGFSITPSTNELLLDVTGVPAAADAASKIFLQRNFI